MLANLRFALVLLRYGRLRPSEINLLTWDDVLWDQQRLVIHSPKTERHQGKGQRIIPLFPELRTHLEDAFELALEKADGGTVTGYVVGAGDYRTHVARLITQAGLKPWPRVAVGPDGDTGDDALRGGRLMATGDGSRNKKYKVVWLPLSAIKPSPENDDI